MKKIIVNWPALFCISVFCTILLLYFCASLIDAAALYKPKIVPLDLTKKSREAKDRETKIAEKIVDLKSNQFLSVHIYEIDENVYEVRVRDKVMNYNDKVIPATSLGMARQIVSNFYNDWARAFFLEEPKGKLIE